MTQMLPTGCNSCLRRKTTTTCEAFPRGIPDNILVWGDKHTDPLPDQKNNLTWVFKPGTEEQFEEWKEFLESVIR